MLPAYGKWKLVLSKGKKASPNIWLTSSMKPAAIQIMLEKMRFGSTSLKTDLWFICYPGIMQLRYLNGYLLHHAQQASPGPVKI